MENNNYNNLATDNISLFEILKMLLNFFKSNIKYFSITVFVGALLGLGYFTFSKHSYESSFTAYANHLKDIQVEEMIDNLSQMQKDNDYNAFANSLNLSIPTAKKINSLKVSINAEIEKEKDEGDAKRGNNFKITANVNNNSILDSLQNGIGFYLGNNPHVKLLREMTDSTTAFEIKEIEKEIEHLKVLRVDVENQVRIGKNVQIIDPASVSMKILELKERIQNLKNGLVFNKQEMIVLQPFVPFKKQASPRLIKSLVSGMAIGLFVGLILALIQQTKTKE